MTRVLTDRHHAGLYRSLQLLGDRLGWDLWTPVGYEWWDAGIWNFGRTHLGTVLRDQYLAIDAQWRASGCADGAWWTEDPEFPGHRIQGVELRTAQRMEWDIVMPTLQENQHGYAAFAQGVGAVFAYQVGNTGQQIDWRLDPLAIVTSEMPILGRGVRIHQEMDPVASTFRDPAEADPLAIGSFVNVMPEIACYPLLVETQRLMPERRWRIHGIACPDGVVKPISAIADVMASCAWGWHDKAHGDGFGHVVHGWAAIGRPLIGHASHYDGRMARHLWRDGETCIDLDQHPSEEVAAIIRATTPERHAEMCRAIRAEFERIDHAAEAEAVRTLLGRAS